MGVAALLIGLAVPTLSLVTLDKPPEFAKPPKFPQVALRNRVGGLVRVRLIVRPNGKVTDCNIVASSGYFALDLGTCVSLRKDAAFAPSAEKNDRQFETGLNWSIAGGGGSAPHALRILETRLFDLRAGQPVSARIPLGACEQAAGFAWCNVGPPPTYMRSDDPSAGKLRLAIDDVTKGVTGFDLKFDSAMTAAALAEVNYHHGQPCYVSRDGVTKGWIAGRSYLVLTDSLMIAGRPEMSPLLKTASATCPPLVP